jgi:magnesium transporter
MAPPQTLIKDLMEGQVLCVRASEDREQVAKEMARYDLLAIPVVDEQHRLVGIITYDDAIDVVVQEATEDAYRMGAVGPLEEKYLEADFFKVWRKRAFWLGVLFLGSMLTFEALAQFHRSLEAVAVLSLYIPLCISTGGNSGSQAATLITRALALGQVSGKDWLKVLKHEFLMGLALGLTLAVVGFFRAWLTRSELLLNPSGSMTDPIRLAMTISQAVIFICIWGTLVGSMLPLVLKRLGIDPGIASSPFVATFVDVTGIMIYFTVANLYLL